MTNVSPSVSVLMPVYNAEKYIQAAVESILKQTFTDFEFIIINDGSTDGTLDILDAYAQQDKRIRLISRENKGLVATLNEGLALAKTLLIARMDADDIALPNRFRDQVDYLRHNVDVVCVGGCAIVIDEMGRELTLLDVPADDDEIQQLLLQGHASFFHPAVMYRKNVVQKIGGYRKDFYPAEDLDLWLRLGEVGKFSNLKDAVIKYRFLSSSISGRMAQQQKTSAKKATEAAWVRRGITGVFEVSGDWRANDSIGAQYFFILKFGWWAFNYKNKKAALSYSFKAIRLLPFNKEGWRLFYCVIFKGA